MSTRQSPGEDKTNACCSCSRRFSCRDVQERIICTRCRGGACPSRRRTCSPYRPSLKWYALPNCHCEGASRPWQSHAPTSEFAEVALLSTRVLRDCTPRALPRAARSGRHVGLRPPRNDTSGEHGAGNGALHRISRPIAASRTDYRYPKFICPQPLRNRPHRPRGARRS